MKNKFIVVDGDMDFVTQKRYLTGRMTKKRWKIIDRYCRRMTYSNRCHHEWDCCGCLTGMDTSFTYQHNQVTIKQTIGFNY